MKKLLFCLLTVFFATTVDCFAAKTICKTKEQCKKGSNCQCYCSVLCGFRDQRPDDNPVYVEDDPHGIHCYCKQWDLDNYEERCKLRNK